MQDDDQNTTIIIFAKSPEGDNVKTRLSSVLTVEKRLLLHKAMLQWTFQQAMLSAAEKVIVAIDGDERHRFFNDLFFITNNNIQLEKRSFNKIYSKKCSFTQQYSGDLGRKMYLSASQELSRDSSNNAVVLIGSDCPFITTRYLDYAINCLSDNPFVIGPASDGGYVLLAMREIIPSIFEDIPWGTDAVYQKTCDVLSLEKKSYTTLATLSDIDRPEDINLLAGYQNKSALFNDFFMS
ncbi:MAG: TIGR04282 family arsenosugar biosynthesis glycosyltransferase [Cellvibrionaceae bacterium]